MKKKSCLTLALILVIVQVLSLFAVLPVAAETSPNYGLIKSTETITVDGKADETIWAHAVWSEQFVKTSGSAADISGFNAKFKAVWSPVEGDDTQMNIHILIVAKGHVTWRAANWRNNIRVRIESSDGTQAFWTGQKQLDDHIISNTNKPNLTGSSSGDASVSFQTYAVNDIANSGTAVYEFSYQMAKADSIKLDVLTSACTNDWTDAQYSWAGMHAGTEPAAGIGTILETNLNAHTIDITKTAQNITIDGIANENAWKFANSSENFQDVGAVALDGFTGNFKALWSPVEGDDTKMNLYILVVAKGHVTWRNANWRNHIRVQIETSDGKVFWTGQKQLDDTIISNTNKPNLTGASSGGANAAFQMYAVNDIANSGTATYEFCYQMNKMDAFKLDIQIGACTNDWAQAECSWAGMTSTNHATEGLGGVVSIIESDSEGVDLTMTDGASIRVDTTNEKMSGIRFASTVNLDQYNALLAQGATVTMGTLIVPTNSLTVKEIADADFTKETLVAKGLVENTHFYDIVNIGNEWVAGEDGTWYATLYDIQDYERLFSAVGYVTVELNGVSTTYYAEYYSVDARSIAQVAETVMDGEIEGDDGRWTAEQEAVLNSFFTREVQS